MSFNNLIFWLFLIVSFIVYWSFRKNSHRLIFLIAASLIFISYQFPLNAFLYLAITLIIYLIARYINNQPINTRNKKNILILGISFALFFLAFYKYREFVLQSIPAKIKPHSFIFNSDDNFLQLFIPIGISFYVFEVIHYLIESYKGKLPKHDLKDFLAFCLFFPTMISGPIKRFTDFKPQIDKISFPKLNDLTKSTKRIIMGMAEKILLANFLIKYADNILFNSNSFLPWQMLLATLAFSAAIYLDFSGYSNVAIGIAKLFGYLVPENFNSPYSKKNISLFWDNWHISLTRWIKDYLFIPLGGSRKGFVRYLINVLIVFGAIGLWHGASWNFVFWGIYHGIGICCYQLIKRVSSSRLKEQQSILSVIASTFITFNFVSLGWVLFRLNLSQSLVFWHKIFTSQTGNYFLFSNVISLFFIIIPLPKIKLNFSFFPNIFSSLKFIRNKKVFISVVFLLQIVFYSALGYLTIILLTETATPFIYENF